MGYIFASVMQKGGVGKTTTTREVGVYLARKGARVLLVDLEPQKNLTQGLGVKDVKYSSYEVVLNPQKSPTYAIVSTEMGVDLIPSVAALQGAERQLVDEVGREFLLKQALEHVRQDYDYILIDTMPHFGTLTQNALVAADAVLVPISVEVYPFEDLPQLDANLALIRKIHPQLRVAGYICTLFDARTRLSTEIEKQIRSRYGDAVFKTVIPRNVKLAEAPAYRISIADYDATGPGAKAYKSLTDELEARYEFKKA